MAITPNTQKGNPMSLVTLTVGKVSPADSKTAGEVASKAREAGELSNRTNYARMVSMLASVLAVVRTGKAVEITDLFPATDPTTGKTQTAPAYHLAHRTLSAGVLRPTWHKVRIVPMVASTMTTGKGTVSGETSTTAKVGRVRLFVAPAD
jgi:hypothetical protein